MKRRDFLKFGAAGSGLAFTGIAGDGLLSSLMQEEEAKKLKKFGLQLYTLRADFPKDPKGVLKQVASFGYKQVESFEGSKGIFWGMTNKEFKEYLDDLDMRIVSSHCDINKDFEKKADEAAAIDMKYLICPYLGAQKSLDDYKKKAEQFNKCGETCKKAGLRFAYHNHDYSFQLQDGQYPQDVMMMNTDSSLVDYEMDIYWVVTAGQDPISWFKKYPNRFTLSHIKDRKKNAGATDKDASVIVGQGGIDFPRILKEARKQGMQYYIVEQERYDNTTPIAAVEADAAYMKTLKI
jgi:sugar phosphate isomerase/epimerase